MKKYVILLAGLVLLVTGLTAFMSPAGANGQEVCPEGDGWTNHIQVDAQSYTHTAPEGYSITENCYKASTTVVIGFGPTVKSTVWNKEGCPDTNGCNYQDISHASFLLVKDEPEPTCETDPTLCEEEPTCETDPTLCEEEPTCETDPTLCEEEPPPTCETDPKLCEEPEKPVKCPDFGTRPPDWRPMPGADVICPEPPVPTFVTKIDHKYTCTHHIRIELMRIAGEWVVVDRWRTPIANTCNKAGKFNPDEQGM